MKVSIIVPVYNVEKYLEKCLDSLVNQTMKDIEIIVVNDGSPDNSQDIVDRYAKKYKNVKSFVKKNGGVSSARNYGIEKATGEFLLFVDGDDYVSTKMAETMYNNAIKKNLDIVVCNMVKFYEDGRKEDYSCNYNLAEDPVRNFIMGDSGPCAKLISREVFSNVKFRNIYYEDLDILPTLVLYTNKIGYIDNKFYYYRQVDGSATRQLEFSDKILDIFKVLDNVKTKLNKDYSEEVEQLYISHLLRTTTLRMLDFNNTKEHLNRVAMFMKDNYPNYRNNRYFKKSSKKMKLICWLAYHKQWMILKAIKKITNK